jgi:hypothetical protein
MCKSFKQRSSQIICLSDIVSVMLQAAEYIHTVLSFPLIWSICLVSFSTNSSTSTWIFFGGFGTTMSVVLEENLFLLHLKVMFILCPITA